MTPKIPPELSKLYSEALRCGKEGELERAALLFEQLVEAAPQNGPLWSDLSATYLALNKRDEAVACAVQAFELAPTDDAVTLRAADLFYALGMLSEAALLYRELQHRHPHSTGFTHRLAALEKARTTEQKRVEAPKTPRFTRSTAHSTTDRITTPPLNPPLLPYVRVSQGKSHFLDNSIAPQSLEPAELRRSVAALMALPPFYLHVGGIADGLLLRATLPEDASNLTILCITTNPLTAKSFYDEIPEVSRLFLLPLIEENEPQKLLITTITNIDNCLGAGITSCRDLSPSVDLASQFGVRPLPQWAQNIPPTRLSTPQVVIAPRGTSPEAHQKRNNVIDPALWSDLLQFLTAAGVTPILLGTPGESGEYPAAPHCLDHRSYSFREQMSLIAGADLVIGSDSWAKTFAALLGKATIVFPSRENGTHQQSSDKSARIFLEPWPTITQVTTLAECIEAIKGTPFWKDTPALPLCTPFSTPAPRASIHQHSSPLSPPTEPAHRSSVTRPLRILMQLRPDAFTVPGGDLRLIEHVSTHLRALGAHVTLSTDEESDLSSFDLVQLCNFARAEQTETAAKRCYAAGIPYTVFTLYEDRPQFYVQMAWTGMCLTEYVRRGQDKRLLSDALKIIPHLVPAPIQDNSWTATHAESLIASGLHEASILRRDYPTTKRIDICHFGSAITTAPVSSELFINTFGVQDFVLCVGRIENRKNQLMLMHALEESDVPLVLLAGAGSYDVDYADAVRQFQRRGETIIIDELSPEMIASAYAASRVHALPSWYELPGLVSLEAALYGTNVVATKNGTAADYFGPLAFYCEPHNPESIRKAVEEAYATPKSELLRACAERFTWRRCAEELLQIYQQILGRNSHLEPPPPLTAHP